MRGIDPQATVSLWSCPTLPHSTTGLQEAAMLLRQGLTPGQTCATRAIGYRQAMEALQHWQADPPTATPAALVRRDSSNLVTL